MSMKEDRAREGKKARYRKMGFGPMMDSGEIDFGDKHPLTKKRLKNFKKKDDAPMSDERFYQQRKAEINKAGLKASKMLTGGQAKLAAKAPPPNKIDAKDFAVLRAEKAKGRGMGLQDEKVKPGKVKPVKAVLGLAAMGLMGAKYLKDKNKKATPMIGAAAELMKKKKELLGKKMGGVMKAKMGVATDYKKYLKGLKKATDSVKKDKENKFLKRRMQLMGMPKLSKGGGYDSGTPGKLRDYSSKFNKDGVTFKNPRVKGPDQSPRLKKLIKRREALDTTKSVLKTLSSVASPVTAAASAAYKLANKMKDKDRLTDRDIETAKSAVGMGSKNRPIKKDHSSRNPNPKTPKMMGGGMMMQRPMGYKHGTSVTAKCKLGRNKPTKIT